MKRRRRIRRFERKRQRIKRETQFVHRDAKPDNHDHGQTPEAWAATWAAP